MKVKDTYIKSYLNNKYYQEKKKFFNEIEIDACLWYKSKNIHVA